MALTSHSKSWFAIQVRPKYEFTSARILRAKGYEEFVPAYCTVRRWSDRRKVIQMPLFSGYVFCRFDGCIWSPILTTPGVVRFVTAGGKQLAQIADAEIQSIRAAINQGPGVLPWDWAKVGSAVRVKDGPLVGTVGVLTSYKNRKYIVITIDAVQRSIAVPLDHCEMAALASHSRMAVQCESDSLQISNDRDSERCSPMKAIVGRVHRGVRQYSC